MRALVSVSDKTNLVKLAHFLSEQSIEIVSSGGTRKHLEDKGFVVTPIEEVTGNPEAFGGRMKTLSFQVSSGILFRRDHQDDLKQADSLGIKAIDIVVCNLYPFAKVKESGGTWDELIENIDIGGPTLIRAAAKNYCDVWTLTKPEDYDRFIEKFQDNADSLNIRKDFARIAFSHTAAYDSLIAETFDEEIMGEAKSVHIDLTKAREVRYGENPHQKGWVYGDKSLATITPLHGKELSYNNYLDADAAWRCLSDLNEFCLQSSEHVESFAVTVIKHSNPCGVSIDPCGIDALVNAWSGDPISAFGSIITCNKEIDKEMAHFLSERFVEVVMAPSFSNDALTLLKQKKNIRLITLEVSKLNRSELMVRTINGGFLVQQEDSFELCDFINMTKEVSAINEDKELGHFGVLVGKHLKSNAIALVKPTTNGFKLIGAGMGNPNRLVSLEQAVAKACENGESLDEAILTSDAFFPFRDNIDLAHKSGIRKIVQPGGSIKDQEVIDACLEHKIQMYFTNKRHFRH